MTDDLTNDAIEDTEEGEATPVTEDDPLADHEAPEEE